MKDFAQGQVLGVCVFFKKNQNHLKQKHIFLNKNI